MKTFIVLPFAEIDIKETINYYLEESDNLAIEFVKILDTSFKDIKLNPLAYSVKKYDIRKYVVEKFEFSIYFIDRAEAIYVIAVYHDKRNPKNWMRRRIKHRFK